MKLTISILAILTFCINAYSQVPNYVPTNGLVGWWPFNGNANDESGHGNNGTVIGATLITDRNGQQAYKFDGINDIININSKVGNFGANDFSVSLWVYDEDTQNSGTLVGKRNDDANMLNLIWSNSPGLELGSPYVLITPKGSMLNEWKNCVLIRKGTNISIYINGVLEQKNVSSMTPNINNSANLSFGARYSYSQTGQHFKGSIDDIGIWNRALSEEEIRILYSLEKVAQNQLSQVPNYVPTSGLVGWWPFNGNANDESGHGNNGTVIGATLITDRNGQQAYKFDGIDDIINVNPKVANFGANDFSVSLWVYDEDAQNSGTLVGKRKDDVSGQAYLSQKAKDQFNNFNKIDGAGLAQLEEPDDISLYEKVPYKDLQYRDGTPVFKPTPTEEGNVWIKTGVDYTSANLFDALTVMIEDQGFTFNQPTDLSADENRYSLYLKDIMDDFPALKSQKGVIRPDQIIYPKADLMVIPSRETCRAVIKKLDYCMKSSSGFDCQKDLLKNKITVLRCGDLEMVGGVLGLKDEYQNILRRGAPYGVADLKRVLGTAQYGSISTESSGIQSDGANKPKNSLLATWNHCLVVRRKNEVSLYVNGVKQQQNLTGNIPNINNSADLCFGARYFYNPTKEHFKGSIDDIGIWNRALTEGEIKGLYSFEQLTQTKLSPEQYYKMVYEGEKDNPYSSFEDYLASQKKENQSELKTNSSNLNSDYANRIIDMNNKLEAINDTIQKIAYLNLVNSQLNPNKSMWTAHDSSIYDNLHLRKLLFIFPKKHNDPKITKADWRDLYDFLINRCNENSFAGSELRPWFLYWNCMVRQYMGTDYFEIKWEQKILEEYTESNFPLGSPFYKECQRIVNGSNSSDSKNTKITNTKPIETPNSSSPLLLSKQPIGTIWSKKNSSIYSNYNVAQLKKTGKSTYEFKWRNSEDEVNSMTLLVKSQTLNPHSASIICPDRYMYSMEEINSSLSWKVDFFYFNDPFGWCCSIILYDELGKKINEWGLIRE